MPRYPFVTLCGLFSIPRGYAPAVGLDVARYGSWTYGLVPALTVYTAFTHTHTFMHTVYYARLLVYAPRWFVVTLRWLTRCPHYRLRVAHCSGCTVAVPWTFYVAISYPFAVTLYSCIRFWLRLPCPSRGSITFPLLHTHTLRTVYLFGLFMPYTRHCRWLYSCCRFGCTRVCGTRCCLCVAPVYGLATLPPPCRCLCRVYSALPCRSVYLCLQVALPFVTFAFTPHFVKHPPRLRFSNITGYAHTHLPCPVAAHTLDSV